MVSVNKKNAINKNNLSFGHKSLLSFFKLTEQYPFSIRLNVCLFAYWSTLIKLLDSSSFI